MRTNSVLSEKQAKLIFLCAALLSLLSSTCLATTIDSKFTCNNENASTTYYTYLKESALEESNYTRGLETGSFNYFRGESANIVDTQFIRDGRIDASNPEGTDNNTSATHHLIVRFDGNKETARGISEFYAKGSYRDNRAVSAWKKVWFANDTYPSNNISVNATAYLNMKGIFDFKYNTFSKNSYFVFTDSAGWTNRSGARRMDWYQSGLMRGEKVQVTNDLRVSSDWISRAPGIEDWLPCTCLSGLTYPPFEPKDSEWPSVEARAVLLPLQLPPNANCSPYNCTGCPNGDCKKCSAIPNCNNFANIFGLGTPTSTTGEALELPKLESLQVEGYFSRVSGGDEISYTINVRNFETTTIEEVKVWTNVPTQAIVPNSAYINDLSTVVRATVDGNSVFELGSLEPTIGPGGVKRINVRVLSSKLNNISPSSVDIYATYKIGSIQGKTRNVTANEISIASEVGGGI
jgi:hypothetical protein